MRQALIIFALLWALGASGQNPIFINSYRFGAAPAANLLLDDYPNAAAAYSLRKLRTAYTGDCIVVRRSSTGDTLAIGFSGNYLDTAALKTFCSGTNCFVRHWYDQSGDGNDLRQTTDANQPQIVASGVISRGVAGEVGLFANVGASMSVPNSKATFKFIHDGTANSLAFVGQMGTSANPNVSTGIAGNNAGTQVANKGFYITYDDRSSVSRNDAYSFLVSGVSDLASISIVSQNQIAPNTEKLIYMDTDADNATAANRNVAYVDNNGAIQANTNTAAISTNNATFDFEIMSLGNRVALFQGYYHELVIWDSSQSANRTGIQSNINSFYSIY